MTDPLPSTRCSDTLPRLDGGREIKALRIVRGDSGHGCVSLDENSMHRLE